MEKFWSILFLWSIFGLVLFLMRKNKTAFIGLLIIIFISSIRWDIGNDFYNYYRRVKWLVRLFNNVDVGDLGENIAPVEITYQFITYIFRNTASPIIGVIATYSTITLGLWYLALKRINGLYWGFFAIFFTGALFLTWDQIRQGASIAIFIYSIKFIESKNLKKYLICCFIAFLFHSSAIILFPLYLTRYLNLKPIIIIPIIGVLAIGFFFNLWTSMFNFIFSLSERYSHYAENKMSLQQVSSGLGLIARIIIYTSAILMTRKQAPVISSIIFIGLCIYLFSCTNEMIERLSTYGTFAIILALPIIMRNLRTDKLKIYKQALVTLIFIIGTYNAYKGVSGCIPYDTVFSQKYELKQFRPRLYMQHRR